MYAIYQTGDVNQLNKFVCRFKFLVICAIEDRNKVTKVRRITENEKQ